MGTGHPPHGELRIVSQRRADADHDGVDEGPQPVQVGEPRRPVDVVGMSGFVATRPSSDWPICADHHQVVDTTIVTVQKAHPRARQG